MPPATVPAAKVGYLIPWGTGAASAMSDLAASGITARASGAGFTLGGRQFGIGTLVVRVDENPADLRARLTTLVTTRAPQRYDFNGFLFTSRRVAQGSRLRLAITPAHSLQFQTNFNSGGDVASESMKEARPVTVTLYHDEAYPSALYVPFAQPIEGG